jgi:hypothetical protein
VVFKLFPIKYDTVRLFDDGLAKVIINGREGFVDQNGVEVIPLKYDTSYYNNGFNRGLARVCLNKKYGYINKQGVEYWED